MKAKFSSPVNSMEIKGILYRLAPVIGDSVLIMDILIRELYMTRVGLAFNRHNAIAELVDAVPVDSRNIYSMETGVPVEYVRSTLINDMSMVAAAIMHYLKADSVLSGFFNICATANCQPKIIGNLDDCVTPYFILEVE